MNVLENMKWRYAVKKFDENQILSEEKINCIKEAFNLPKKNKKLIETYEENGRILEHLQITR